MSRAERIPGSSGWHRRNAFVRRRANRVLHSRAGFSDHFCRIAGRQYICRQGMYHHAVCANNRILSDSNAFKNKTICAQPDFILDYYWHRCHLTGGADGMPIEVSNRGIRSAQNPIANFYRLIGTNARPAKAAFFSDNNFCMIGMSRKQTAVI